MIRNNKRDAGSNEEGQEGHCPKYIQQHNIDSGEAKGRKSDLGWDKTPMSRKQEGGVAYGALQVLGGADFRSP